jgi:tRNA threonylcarbamoyl adenosine modification protein (Sua5/YciO/YrdC/YwlC family)
MSKILELYHAGDSLELSDLLQDLNNGAVVAYPTDSGYALGCKLGLKKPLKKIQKIRHLDPDHQLTLMCENLKQMSDYVRIDNHYFRVLKKCLPGPYTFILPVNLKASKLLDSKRKTVGIRVSEHMAVQTLLAKIGEPLLSASLSLPDQITPFAYADEVAEHLQSDIDWIIDSGYCGTEPTSIVDCSDTAPKLIRQGLGEIGFL